MIYYILAFQKNYTKNTIALLFRTLNQNRLFFLQFHKKKTTPSQEKSLVFQMIYLVGRDDFCPNTIVDAEHIRGISKNLCILKDCI